MAQDRFRRGATQLLFECAHTGMTDEERVEHLGAALQAAEMAGAVAAAEQIQTRLRRAAEVVSGCDATAAEALRDYAGRITSEWGYQP